MSPVSSVSRVPQGSAAQQERLGPGERGTESGSAVSTDIMKTDEETEEDEGS